VYKLTVVSKQCKSYLVRVAFYTKKLFTERRDLVFALNTQKTIMFHEFAPNLVNLHFPIRRTSRLEQFTRVHPC